jgi:hypothetical protein
MKFLSIPSTVLSTAFFSCVLTACHAEPAARQLAEVISPLQQIMGPLVNNQSFRMSAAAFDQLVAPYCKKTSGDADNGSITAEYSCGKETGITEIKIDARQNGKPGTNHMAYVLMFLSWDSYMPLKRQMEKQLGRASTSGKDYITWKYRADKQLNALGDPSFQLSRDPSDKTTTFQLGIEQGP